jgi:16S rRNA processing protein RimM
MGSRSSIPEGPSAAGSSAQETLPERPLPERIEVGQIVRPHGVRGGVLVRPESDNPERFKSGNELFARLADGTSRTLRIDASADHAGGLLMRFEGVDDREAAVALRGAQLSILRQQVPPAEAGAYYYFELVGCRVEDQQAGDLGAVIDVLEDGGGLLLLVDDGRRQLPIPFVQRFLKQVDIRLGKIRMDLPPGLIEACASTS